MLGGGGIPGLAHPSGSEQLSRLPGLIRPRLAGGLAGRGDKSVGRWVDGKDSEEGKGRREGEKEKGKEAQERRLKEMRKEGRGKERGRKERRRGLGGQLE